jgi:polyhydroxybutyrate depolymerase
VTSAAAAIIMLMVLSACGSGSSGSGGASDDRPAATGATDTTHASGATDPVTDEDSGSVGEGPPAGEAVSWDVDGVTRTARLVVPDDLGQPAPLVLAYHGHGGSGANFERKMSIESLWPEAIVVYPDGLVGHQGRTDPEGVRTGWQQDADDEGGRDLRFFDVMMADLRSRLPIDPQRIFVVGHSNGSAFTSLLLNQRGDQIAATANLAGQPGRLLATDPVRSMFMMMGEQDPVVPYDGQRRSIPLAESKLGVDPATATVDGYLRRQTGPDGLELATYIHPGGHEVPAEVPPLVVAFFQRHHLGEGA